MLWVAEESGQTEGEKGFRPQATVGCVNDERPTLWPLGSSNSTAERMTYLARWEGFEPPTF